MDRENRGPDHHQTDPNSGNGQGTVIKPRECKTTKSHLR